MDEYKVASEKVKGENGYFLIGPTGAGKSTTLHYLAGSKMIKIEEKLRYGSI